MHSDFANVILLFGRFNTHIQAYYAANRGFVFLVWFGLTAVLCLIGRYLKYGYVFGDPQERSFRHQERKNAKELKKLVANDTGIPMQVTICSQGNNTNHTSNNVGNYQQMQAQHIGQMSSIMNNALAMQLVNQYGSQLISYALSKDDTNYSHSFNNGKKATTYYHGGPMEGIMDIYNNRRIRLGSSDPKGLWMSPNFEVAYSYGQGWKGNSSIGGGIIELLVEDDVDLTFIGTDYFVLEIPKGVQGEYWTFDSGIYTVAVYDMQRNIIT